MDRRSFFGMVAGASVLPLVPNRQSQPEIDIKIEAEAEKPKKRGSLTFTIHCNTDEFNRKMAEVEARLNRLSRLRQSLDS